MPRLVFNTENPKFRVLFMGYNETQTSLLSSLKDFGCQVWHCDTKFISCLDFDCIVCFGYRYLIGPDILRKISYKIVNLHISYLPWNKGAHPNFWAFFEGTPSGITIHEIDAGLDTGNIIFQKRIFFNANNLTFSESYAFLKSEIENLFTDNIHRILNKDYVTSAQDISTGSYHTKNELPAAFSGWHVNIQNEINRLRR